MKKSLLALLITLPVAASAAPVTPLWMRDVKISPDGRTVLFAYKGDLWTVPVAGGAATRLTATPDEYEANAVWSPDSRRVAYSSDRHGNFDVFVIDADGSNPTRLTFNSASEIPEAFTPDGKAVLFSASIQDPAASALFPSGRMTELYRVAVSAEPTTPEQILATPARFISWAPDGKSFFYQDVKGFEDEWRKHHTSSVTRDIWRYDLGSHRHTNLTARAGEDLNPVAQGKNVYFLSERDGGTMNVYCAPARDMASAQAVTDFTTHPVRFLSAAADGTLAFTWNGEIYTMHQGQKPELLSVTVDAPDVELPEKVSVRSARSAKVSPDGKLVAFINRGNVFVTSVEYNTTKQITDTPQAEYDVQWDPNSRSVIFTSEMDGAYNIYRASMTRDEAEYDLANATLIKIEPLFDADGHERTMARISPDGKKMAFLLDRNQLWVMDLGTKAVHQLTDGSTNPRQGMGFDYAWSPDSKWLLMEVTDRRHHPYSDIAIVNATDGKMINLTGTGYFDESPRWVLDGNAIMFISERYGMRNHASWGSQGDVMLVFLNQKAYDRFRLSEEELEIADAMEKKAREAAGDDAPKPDKTIVVEPGDFAARTVRLTPMSSDIRDAMITADGETLFFVTPDGDDGARIWKVTLRGDADLTMASHQGSLGSFDMTPDGKKAFYFGSSLRKFDTKGVKFTTIPFSSSQTIDHAAEREYMFDYVTREERERFYRTDMHGVDWASLTDDYRRFLPHINNNYDFAELLSEMLGELNVSHTGGRYSASTTSQSDRTASLGLLYDLTYTGKGVKVAEVIVGSPFDLAASHMAPGAIISAIDGRPVTPTTDLTHLLCDKAGDKVLVTFTVDGKRYDETVKAISAGRQNALLYDRWVRARAADVDRWSKGRLGYVHIESMDDESFRRVYADLLGKYNDREGVVIDVRWNGGGRLHEDIEVLFSGHKYFTQVLRGTEVCDMPSRRWNKPSIMVISEACYSNAHGTPWVYSNRGLGKLVGMPVPGTMTSVNWVRMQDSSLVFGIPVIGYQLPDGSYLENSQLEPDIRVANDPSVIVTGEDQQLRAAVDDLLRTIDGK